MLCEEGSSHVNLETFDPSVFGRDAKVGCLVPAHVNLTSIQHFICRVQTHYMLSTPVSYRLCFLFLLDVVLTTEPDTLLRWTCVSPSVLFGRTICLHSASLNKVIVIPLKTCPHRKRRSLPARFLSGNGLRLAVSYSNRTNKHVLSSTFRGSVAITATS